MEIISKESIEKALITLIPILFKWGNKFYKDSKFKVEEELGTIYREYLEYSYGKYVTVKTLLYKNEGKFLYDFYEPQFLESQDGDLIDTTNTNLIFQKNKKIIVTGTGGIGKSMLMKHIFINQIDNANSVPVFIELKSINDVLIEDFVLEDFIFSELKRHHLSIDQEYFEQSLKSGSYTIIFDGLDEVASTHRSKLDQSLKSFIDLYDKNNYIISSRPADDFIGWSDYIEFEIEPLNKTQAVSLIGRLDYDSKIKNKFSKELRDSLYDNHESFASIPLLLTIMLMTYEDGASIPNNLTDFYNQAFYTLYQKHDASKSGFKRELKANLSPEIFKEVLSYIAMKTFFKGNVDFNIDMFNDYLNLFKEKNNTRFTNTDFMKDSIDSVCMILQEGVNYKFAHRSFQEFFAANGVSKLDDITQKKLLTAWAYEDRNHIVYNKTFLTTLLTIQKTRTYLNLYMEIIKKTKDLYDESANLDNVISNFFDTFQLSNYYQRNGERKIIFVVNKDYGSFFKLHFRIIKDVGYSLEDIDDTEKLKQCEKRLVQFLDVNEKIPYEELPNEGKTVLKQWLEAWFVKRLEFIFHWAEQVIENNKTKKRTTASIIDDI